jgi:hypothetical protein
MGMTGLPLAIVPHPIAELKPDEVRERGDRIIDDIVQALTKPPERQGARESCD